MIGSDSASALLILILFYGIRLTGSLGLQTIVEGVGTEEQLNFLRDNGGDKIQDTISACHDQPTRSKRYCAEPLLGTVLKDENRLSFMVT